MLLNRRGSAGRTKASQNRIRVRPQLEVLESRTLLDTKIWTGMADNDWGNAANWSGGVPGPLDTAVFDNTAIRTAPVIDSDTMVNKIMVQSTWSGSITDHASLTITGGLTLASGTFGGSGSILIGGSSTWTGGELEVGGSIMLTSGTFELRNSLDAVTMNGGGTLTNAAVVTDAGVGLKIRGGATVENTGTWDIQSDHDISYGIPSTGQFKNLGTISKTLGAGTASIRMDFTNDGGSFLVTAGTFQVVSSNGLFRGGSFTVDRDARMDLTGGASTRFTGPFSGSGAGTLRLNSGILHVINYMQSGGATFNFAGNLFQWQGGTITIDSDAALINTGILNFASSSGMNLNGGGTLTDAGAIVHSGTGNLSITASNTLNIMDGHVYEFRADAGITGATATIIEPGTFSKTAGTGTSFFGTKFQGIANIDVETGTFKIEPSSSIVSSGNFTVAPGAILDMTGGTSVSYTGTFTGSGGGAVQFNGGILHVVTTTDPMGATFDFPAALFQWKAGILTIDPGASLTNADTMTLANPDQVVLNGNGALINNGTFNQVGTANLSITSMNVITNNGTWDFGADSNITGSGGTFHNVGLIQKTGSTGTSFISTKWQGPMNVDVESGTFKMTVDLSSTVTNGTITVASGAVLDLTGGQAVNYTGVFVGSGDGTVQLNGGIAKIVATSDSSSATFNFPPGMLRWLAGILTINPDASLTIAGTMTLANVSEVNVNGGGPFIDAGTLIESGAGGLRVTGGNVVSILAGGLFDIQVDAGILPSFSGGTINNFGTLQKSGGTGTATIGLAFTNEDTPDNPNSDLVAALSGTLSFTNSYLQTAGDTNLNGGAIAVSSTLSLMGGVLDGSGDVFASVVNAGRVSPGGDLAAGLITIHGSYTQTSAGTLSIEIGGTNAGTDFDQLVVTGAATLDGTLNVSLINGFVPDPGTTFTIMTFASYSGAFATLNFDPAFVSPPTYDPIDVTLVATAPPARSGRADQC
jgi:hypothetical protein